MVLNGSRLRVDVPRRSSAQDVLFARWKSIRLERPSGGIEMRDSEICSSLKFSGSCRTFHLSSLSIMAMKHSPLRPDGKHLTTDTGEFNSYIKMWAIGRSKGAPQVQLGTQDDSDTNENQIPAGTDSQRRSLVQGFEDADESPCSSYLDGLNSPVIGDQSYIEDDDNSSEPWGRMRNRTVDDDSDCNADLTPTDRKKAFDEADPILFLDTSRKS
ncbi:hypothetical protein SCHPADRAFT_52900 [Schizopora paradoxa]|uniref:Uncharacterized protein n=1 Tax=Schizopora paradoxa TaxID=27342 RepID=A0A0H2S6R1_9AGAM|nr:hypothetical protein SCHPADRAFT_52900 [Schizopora paradoxa]